jgi:hypothetical protein
MAVMIFGMMRTQMTISDGADEDEPSELATGNSFIEVQDRTRKANCLV